MSLRPRNYPEKPYTKKIYFSQSVVLGSLTIWIPIVNDTSVSYDVWSSMQFHTSQSVQIVQNLTMQQKRAFNEENLVPHAFFPHIGLFAKDFTVGAILQKK